MRKFDTKVQHLKYKVLREVARYAWEDTLQENLMNIPKIIVPGNEPSMRCCVYKERAILAERIKLAMGGDTTNPNVIEVIDIACDECPSAGYEVTDSCRGCLAHRCEDVCKRGAISFDKNHVAVIDKSKCVECGKCERHCPQHIEIRKELKMTAQHQMFIAVYFDVSPEICKARNAQRSGRALVPDSVIDNMSKNFTKPTYGFDEVWTIDFEGRRFFYFIYLI